MDPTAVPRRFELELPSWVDAFLAGHPRTLADVGDRMGLVVDLARAHVLEGTGGPFGAAVFASDTSTLLAVGVNLVVPAHACIAHAEVVALALAGQRLGHFDLGSSGPTELVTTVEPCAMCLGAIGWSGVGRVVCGARDADARAIGFDEGDKPDDWARSFAARGIDVVADVRRADAAAVLALYAERGGEIYNSSVRRRPADT